MSAGEWFEMLVSLKFRPAYQIDLNLTNSVIVEVSGTWTATVDRAKLPEWNEPRKIVVISSSPSGSAENKAMSYQFSGYYHDQNDKRIAAVYRESFFNSRRVVISYEPRTVFFCSDQFVKPVWRNSARPL